MGEISSLVWINRLTSWITSENSVFIFSLQIVSWKLINFSCLLLIVAKKISIFLQPHLGEFSERLFTDPAAEEAIALFRDKLNKVSQVIVERNSKLEFPYIYLLPENVPNSVAV